MELDVSSKPILTSDNEVSVDKTVTKCVVSSRENLDRIDTDLFPRAESPDKPFGWITNSWHENVSRK